MTQVITAEQAKKITGGRTPLVPVEYESAVKALQACMTIDEAKYWSDKSDALAAWARIHRNDEAGTAARKLKLYAYRRMSLLAEELRPIRGRKDGGGLSPGPASALHDAGLTQGQVTAIRRIGAIPEKTFKKIISSSSPPGIYRAGLELGRGLRSFGVAQRSSDAWRILNGSGPGAGLLRQFVAQVCRKLEAKNIARDVNADEANDARRLCTEATEWLDAFEQALPKVKP